jgi:hypothetical protein
VNSFQHLIECIDKSNKSIKFAESKKEELNSSIGDIYPKLETLISTTKSLKSNIEKSLMKQYPGRTVNIIGEVNNI